MANKSIKKNFLFNLIYQILILVAPLFVTPYVSRILGVSGIGEYSYASSIVAYFTLFAVLGTTLYGQRSIGYVQQNIEERSRIFWEIFIFRLVTCAITLGAYSVYLFVFVAKSQRVIALILTLNILNVMFDISWFMQGMEEFGKTASISIVFRILHIVSVFVFVKTASDLWKYVLFSVGFSVIGNIVLWLVLPKYICKVKGIKPFKDIKSIIQLFLPTLATQIYTVLDKSMIGWFANNYDENGYYEQAEKIVKIAVTVVTSLGVVMIPRIARCFKEDDFNQVKYYIYKSYRFVWMMAIPIMFGLIIVADVFVPVFFGEGYEKCSVLIMIMSGLTIAMGLGHVTGLQFFVPTERQNVLTITYIIGAALNVTLNLILIPLYSSIGAAIATIIAEFGVAISGLIYVRKKKLFEVKPVITCSWKYWICGIIMAVAVYVVKLFVPVTVWALIVLILVGVFVYFIALLIFRDALVFEALSKVLGRFKRKNNITANNETGVVEEQPESVSPVNENTDETGEIGEE